MRCLPLLLGCGLFGDRAWRGILHEGGQFGGGHNPHQALLRVHLRQTAAIGQE